MVPFVKEILDCRHLTFLPYILIFGIFLPNPQILLHTSWKMSRYSFHPGFCKTYCTPLPPPHHIYYTFEGVYNWRSNTVVKGSISTSKPFDIFFSGSCCWSLGRLEDVEVVSPLEVAETLEEDSLPSLPSLAILLWFSYFSLKRVVLTTFVWLFCFLALCVLLNL